MVMVSSSAIAHDLGKIAHRLTSGGNRGPRLQLSAASWVFPSQDPGDSLVSHPSSYVSIPVP